LRHTVIYSNKHWDDVIYRDALTALERAHPDRVKVVHTLTRQDDASVFDAAVRKGRLAEPLLREFIPAPTECVVYVCGPGISKFDVEAAKQAGTVPQPRFLESVLADLKTLGVPASRIKREFYG